MPRLFLALVFVLSLLTHCAAPPADVATEDVASVSQSTLDERLVGTLQSLVDDRMVVGAVGIVAHHGEIVFRGAAGYADREADVAMTSDDLFRIASMTKAITSVAAMILYDRGKLALDDPISKFLPEFANPNVLETHEDGSVTEASAQTAITIRHLLTHTSGVNYRFIARGELLKRYEAAEISDGLARTDFDLAEAVRRLASVPLSHEPGEGWTYGLSTDVLGRLVEVVSGENLDAFIQQTILQPLRMNATRFYLPESEFERLASVYRPDGAGGLELISGTVEDGSTFFSVDAVTTGPRKYFSGGAGLVSTAEDYLRFCQMILNRGELDGERILEAETVDQMLQNQIGELTLGLTEGKFGLGFSIAAQPVDGIPAGARGWGGFYGSEFWIDPEREIVAVFMSQVYDLTRRNEIVRRFGREVFQMLAELGP